MDKRYIDWSKFKVKAKGKNLEKAKNSYIEFCEMLTESDFELIGNYVRTMDKVELAYKFTDEIRFDMKPNNFKTQTYKRIINFKENLEQNKDEFIRFIGLGDSGNLIAQIKTFDGGEIELGISNYNSFNKSRKDTYNYCEERGYKILSPYISNKDKILIDFNCGRDPNWIKPHNLKNNRECPICSESKGEKAIRLYLENNEIKFKQEYKFENCKYKNQLPFDFYISEYNLCIEFDGEQHYKAFEYFGGEKSFRSTKIRDKIKNKYCSDNKINLLRIPYYKIDNVEKILDEELSRLRDKLKEAC